MAEVWTHGVWRVKSGHEDEFVRWWTSTVDAGEAFGVRGATLLRDRRLLEGVEMLTLDEEYPGG